jgi:hypothetical protein
MPIVLLRKTNVLEDNNVNGPVVAGLLMEVAAGPKQRRKNR